MEERLQCKQGYLSQKSKKEDLFFMSKVLKLQRLSADGGNGTKKKSNLSIICIGGQGSSISLHSCTSLGGL